MIIKKKILSNEIITKNKNIIDFKDTRLFHKDLVNKTGESYSYNLSKIYVLGNGKIFTFNRDIISDYLSFNSLSKFVLLKKVILYLDYIFKIILKRIFTKKKSINKNCILIHNRSSIGYFHWITDTLPKVIYAKKNYKNFVIILPYKLKINFVISSLKKLKVKFFFLKNDNNYFFKNLIYIGNLYPSGNPRKKIIYDLKKKFHSKLKNSKRIYISRNKSERRKITNEANLIQILKNYKFKTVYSEKMSLHKQIKIFSSAKYVLGLHGAGLTNSIWMKKKSYLIEIKPERDLYLNCYFNLANLLSLNYHYIICKKKNIFKTSKNSNYEVDINEIKKKLSKIIK